MDMNLDSFSFVGLGINGIGLIATLYALPTEHIDDFFTFVDSVN